VVTSQNVCVAGLKAPLVLHRHCAFEDVTHSGEESRSTAMAASEAPAR
jgi:hypothetical protein